MAEEGKSGNAGTGASEGAGKDIPEVFVKFVDPATGTVDMKKAAEAYRQAEQKITSTTEEKNRYKGAYEEATRKVNGGSDEGKESGRGLTVEELLTDPESAISKVVEAKTAKATRSIAEKLIEKEHPEVARKADGTFKDPEFVDGLNKFAGTLPTAIQQSVRAGDTSAQMWVIEQYKAAKKGAASASEQGEKGTPFSESGKGSGSGHEGPKYKRSEIRRMVRDNPKEYAAKASEIEKAYEEGRVILD